MAYAFDKINNLVGEGEQSGTDIFSGGVASNAEEEPTGGGGVVPKTSTSGDIGDTSTGGTGEVKAEQDTGDQVSASDVMKANVGKTEAPKALEGIQQQVQSNTQALQKQADDYTQSYKDQYQFDIENQALDQAIQGGYGSDQYKEADTLLQRQDPGAAQQFEGADDYRVSDVNLLKTDAGLGHLAAQGRGPQYTQGMGAFDVMLMKRDPRFNEMINQIRGESAALDQDIDARPDELEAQAYEYGQGQLESAQGSARDYIGGYNERLRAENEAEADAYEAEVATLDRGAIGAEELSGVEKEIRDLFGGEYKGGRYEQQIQDAIAGYDPSERIKFNEADYDYRDFLNEGEANELSNIGGLLGTGEAFTESIGPGEMYTADKAGMYDELRSGISQARATRDLEQEAAIREIMNAAEGRATTEEERRSGLVDSYEADLQAAAQAAANKYRYMGIDPGDISDYGAQNAMEANPDMLRDIGASDMLTADEVAQLQAIQGDLGYDREYAVGGGGGGSFIDQGDIERFLLERARGRQGQVNADRTAQAESDAAAAEAERVRLSKRSALQRIQEGG
jgi:hypothetical protein